MSLVGLFLLGDRADRNLGLVVLDSTKGLFPGFVSTGITWLWVK